MLLKPFDVYEAGTCDQYLSGFMNQVSQAVDESMTQEVLFTYNVVYILIIKAVF